MRLPGLALLALAVWLAPAARAADDDEVVVGPILANPAAEQVQFAEQNFDQWMFQNVGNAQQGEQRIRTQVKLQLAEIDRVCELADPQQHKLELAARGDIERFLLEVETLRRKFKEKMQDQNAINLMWQEIQPLQLKQTRGLTGHGSLFVRSLPAVLTPEQAARYEAVSEERRRFRYQASIAVALHTIEATVALKHEQRQALQKLLLELPPPKAFGQYDHYLIMYRLAAVPPEKIQPLLDDRQWANLKKQFDQFRGMREFLFQQGLLDREELGATAAAEVQP